MWNEYFLCAAVWDEEPWEIKNERLMETLWLWDPALRTWEHLFESLSLGGACGLVIIFFMRAELPGWVLRLM